jgi:F-type H+-transporting ATPase subunit a
MIRQGIDLGEMIMHHTADCYCIGLGEAFPSANLTWHKLPWLDVHLGSLTINLTPTKHIILLTFAALLVFLTLRSGAAAVEKRHREGKAPRGFGGMVEAAVLWVRDDIAIANIGHDGAKFAPFIATLFFLILFSNLLGLFPHLASPTGNLAVTAALAILAFLTIEISGMLKLGFKGYMKTIFPPAPGLSGAGAVALSLAMAPIEVLGKLVKPFALAVRLFGNMTAGHFVILSIFGLIFLFGHLAVVNWGIGVFASVLVFGVMCLELIVAFLQAYVFALLTAVFIGLMQHEHH